MNLSKFVKYVKQRTVWKDKPDLSTPALAKHFMGYDSGIFANNEAIEEIKTAVISQIVNDPNKIASMAALFAVNDKVTQLYSNLGGLKSKDILDVGYTMAQIDACIQHHYASLSVGTSLLSIAVSDGTSYVYLNKRSETHGNYQRASYWDASPTYATLSDGVWKTRGQYVTNIDNPVLNSPGSINKIGHIGLQQDSSGPYIAFYVGDNRVGYIRLLQ